MEIKDKELHRIAITAIIYNADRKYLVNLEKTIRAMGWIRSRDQLRMFRHQTTADIIEIEPGGPKIGGHLLHHQKWESQ